MKTLKKMPVFSLVVGLLLTIYAILTRIIKDVAFFNPSATFGRIIIGAFLILFAIFLSFPPAFSKKNGTAKTLKFIEGMILLFGGVVGFILPVFEINLISINSGFSLWFGLALVMNGTVDLYLGTHGKGNTKGFTFLGKLLAVILGTYVYATDYVGRRLDLVTFAVLLGAGLALTLIGLLNLKKK